LEEIKRSDSIMQMGGGCYGRFKDVHEGKGVAMVYLRL